MLLANSHSSTRHSTMAPQPINTAEEYKFVTNTPQRPERYMRHSNAQVWTSTVSTANQKAARLNGCDQLNQARQHSRKTMT